MAKRRGVQRWAKKDKDSESSGDDTKREPSYEEIMATLFARYPEMKPVKAPPTVLSVNGFGTCFYGERDYEELGETYVETLWYVMAHIPIYAIAAYRIAPAGRGKFLYIGEVPLTRYAKSIHVPLWSSIIIAIAAGLFYSYNFSTSGQIASAIRRAERAEKDRDIYESWRLTVQAYRLDPKRPETIRLIRQTMEKVLPGAKPSQIDEILSNPDLICRDIFTDSDWVKVIQGVLKDLNIKKEPRESLKLLEKWRMFVKDPKEYLNTVRYILEDWMRFESARRGVAEALVGIYRELGEEELAKSMLESN